MNYARLRSLGAALLVAALILLFFWKLVFTNLILVGVDSLLYFYPYKAYVAQALSAGRFPLWNPHLFMGAPLFANMQTAILYPPHWPLLWLPAPKQVTASIVLHVALAGWGTVAYARRSLKLGWYGALTAAVIFALGGFVGAQTEHVNQLNVMAWLPWAFLLLDVSVQSRRRLAPTLGLGLVVALMLLAGHAQATFICLVALGLYAVAGGWGGGDKYQMSNLKYQMGGRRALVFCIPSAISWRVGDRGCYWRVAGRSATPAHPGIVSPVGAQWGAALSRGGLLQPAALAVALHAVASLRH